MTTKKQAKAKKQIKEEPLGKQLWKVADKLRKNIDAVALMLEKIEVVSGASSRNEKYCTLKISPRA